MKPDACIEIKTSAGRYRPLLTASHALTTVSSAIREASKPCTASALALGAAGA